MSIREMLLEATGVKPKKNEVDADLIKRLISKAETLDEEGWESLSTEAQEFYNSVIEAGKKHADGEILELSADDVPPFPDEDDGVVEDGEDERGEEEPEDDTNDEPGEEEVMETKTKKIAATKKTPAKKAADKPAAKKTAASKKNGSGEKKPLSMRRRLKQIVIKKPSISVEDLMSKLKDEGYKGTEMTIGSMRADTRDTMKALVDAGLLEIEL
jgi:hypothetical protein